MADGAAEYIELAEPSAPGTHSGSGRQWQNYLPFCGNDTANSAESNRVESGFVRPGLDGRVSSLLATSEYFLPEAQGITGDAYVAAVNAKDSLVKLYSLVAKRCVASVPVKSTSAVKCRVFCNRGGRDFFCAAETSPGTSLLTIVSIVNGRVLFSGKPARERMPEYIGISDDQKMIFVAQQGSVVARSAENFEVQLFEFEGFNYGHNNLSVKALSNPPRLAMSNKKMLMMNDQTTGKLLWSVELANTDGDLIAACCHDRIVMRSDSYNCDIRSTRDGSVVSSLTGKLIAVRPRQIVFGQDMVKEAILTEDYSVLVYDGVTEECTGRITPEMLRFEWGQDADITVTGTLRLSADVSHVAVPLRRNDGSPCHCVNVYDASTGNLVRSHTTDAGILKVCFSPSADSIIVFETSGALHQLNLHRARYTWRDEPLKLNFLEEVGVKCSSIHGGVVVGETVKVLDVASRSFDVELAVRDSYSGNVTVLERGESAAGIQMVLVGEGLVASKAAGTTTVRLRSARDGAEVCEVPVDASTDIVPSPSAHLFMSGPASVICWNADTRDIVTSPALDGPVGVFPAPGGDCAIVKSRSGLKLWNVVMNDITKISSDAAFCGSTNANSVDIEWIFDGAFAFVTQTAAGVARLYSVVSGTFVFVNDFVPIRNSHTFVECHEMSSERCVFTTHSRYGSPFEANSDPSRLWRVCVFDRVSSQVIKRSVLPQLTAAGLDYVLCHGLDGWILNTFVAENGVPGVRIMDIYSGRTVGEMWGKEVALPHSLARGVCTMLGRHQGLFSFNSNAEFAVQLYLVQPHAVVPDLAYIHLCQGMINSPHKGGWTMLHEIVERDDVGVLRRMIAAGTGMNLGAKVLEGGNRVNVLGLAMKRRSTACVEALCEASLGLEGNWFGLASSYPHLLKPALTSFYHEMSDTVLGVTNPKAPLGPDDIVTATSNHANALDRMDTTTWGRYMRSLRKSGNNRAVHAFYAGIPDFAGYYGNLSDSPLHAIVAVGDVTVMDLTAVRVLVDFKWNRFGRGTFLRSLGVYSAYLLLFNLTVVARLGGNDGPLRNAMTFLVMAFVVYYLLVEARQMALKGPLSYLADPWNYLEVASYALVLCGMLMHYHRNPYSAEILGSATVMVWMKLSSFARGFEGTGTFVKMFFTVLVDIKYFMGLLALVVIGFTAGFHVIMVPEGESDGTLFDTIPMACLTLYRALLGDFDIGDYENSPSPTLAVAFFVIFMFIVSIILLNVLIAILSDSYAAIQGDAEREFMFERARLLCEMEGDIPAFSRKQLRLKWFPKHLHFLTASSNGLDRGDKTMSLEDTSDQIITRVKHLMLEGEERIAARVIAAVTEQLSMKRKHRAKILRESNVDAKATE